MKLYLLLACIYALTNPACRPFDPYSDSQLILSGGLSSTTKVQVSGRALVGGSCSFSSAGFDIGSGLSGTCANRPFPDFALTCSTISLSGVSNFVNGNIVSGVGFTGAFSKAAGCTQFVDTVPTDIESVLQTISDTFSAAPATVSGPSVNFNGVVLSITGNNNPSFEIVTIPLFVANFSNGSITFTNIAITATVILNLQSANINWSNIALPAGFDSRKILLNFNTATSLTLDHSNVALRASILAPQAAIVDNTLAGSTNAILGQVAARSMSGTILVGDGTDRAIEFCPLAIEPRVSSNCAREFNLINSELTFSKFNVPVQYLAFTPISASFKFITLNGSPLGGVSLTAVLSRTFLNGVATPYQPNTLTLNMVFENHGPKVDGDPVPFFYNLVQADWMYFDLISATIIDENSQAVSTRIAKSFQRILQVGTGANGTDGVYGFAFRFEFRFPTSSGAFISGAFISAQLTTTCPCTNIYNIVNDDLNTSSTSKLGVFDPAYSKSPLQLNTMFASNMVMYGIDAIGNNDVSSFADSVVRISGDLISSKGITDGVLSFDLWFTLSPSNLPGTGYARIVNQNNYLLYGDWKFYDLVRGTFDDRFNGALYNVLFRNSEFFPDLVSPTGQNGPFLQIGTGANSVNDFFGMFFAGQYRLFNRAGFQKSVNLTGSMIATC